MLPKLIYLLEDDADILQLLQMLLRSSGYRVSGYTTATNFKKAVALQSPDLFIMDINLPDGNGLDISLELSRSPSTASIPILLMSANAAYSEQYIQAGARGFIAKPFQLVALKTTVQKFI